MTSGPRSDSRRRQREAARRIGRCDLYGEVDGEFQPSLANRERITRMIRELRPDILVTHDPWRRYQLHPDHRNVGICALDTMIAAGITYSSLTFSKKD